MAGEAIGHSNGHSADAASLPRGHLDRLAGDPPETLVLKPPGGPPDPYALDRFGTYEQLLDTGGFAFPVTRLDGQPAASELVIGVNVSGAARVYPVESLALAVVNDGLANTPLVVFSNGSAGGSVFRRVRDGEPLTFVEEDGRFQDIETGSEWDFSGHAISGPLQGLALEPLPSRTMVWPAYAGAFPDSEVYHPPTTTR